MIFLRISQKIIKYVLSMNESERFSRKLQRIIVVDGAKDWRVLKEIYIIILRKSGTAINILRNENLTLLDD